MKLRYKLNLFIIGLLVLSISIPFSIYYYFTKSGDVLRRQKWTHSHFQGQAFVRY